MWTIYFSILLLFSKWSGAQAPDSISPAALEHHVRVLASDSLKGRGNHQPAQALAVRYITGVFEQAGLKPFPAFPGYQQPFTQAGGKVVPLDSAGALFGNLCNVVGMLKGKTQPNEIVIVSAHFDHLGVEKGSRKDSIMNGANDNASGTAAVLELARYFARRGDNDRTLLFCAFGGEELGLLGSQLVAKMLKPESVVAQFNIEMIGMPQYGKNRFCITGASYSDLARFVDAKTKGGATKRVGEALEEKKLFYRSDNYPFAAKGVPAHTFMSSDDDERCYHSPCDDAGRLDYAHMQNLVNSLATVLVPIVKAEFTPRRIRAASLERYPYLETEH
jgi:Zn-dependent M28 family amino/carboxypeptidase